MAKKNKMKGEKKAKTETKTETKTKKTSKVTPPEAKLTLTPKVQETPKPAEPKSTLAPKAFPFEKATSPVVPKPRSEGHNLTPRMNLAPVKPAPVILKPEPKPEIDAKKIATESDPGQFISPVREWKNDSSTNYTFGRLYLKDGRMHIDGSFITQTYSGADNVPRYVTDDGKTWKQCR